jgi:hypothetical protein
MSLLLLASACLAGLAAGDPVPPDLPDSDVVWPNLTSHRNSDGWLWRNHDALVRMRPRVLVLNFANDVSMEEVRRHAEGVVRATAEATRYHGYEDPEAPAFLEYDLVRCVDLRDPTGSTAGTRVTSSRMPRKKLRLPGEPLIDYGGLFGPELAAGYGFSDPRAPERFLDLRELVEYGFVHELWFYAIHDAGDGWPGLETCESKQFYDEACRPIDGRHGQAGNGFDRTMPWLGRSFRIAFFNPHRGIGCAMENFGHTLEATASTGSIAYFARYFREYADMDLDQRFGLPFPSFYSVDYAADEAIGYPTSTSAVVVLGGEAHEIPSYVAHGGNVHFPPGARRHYDLASPCRVMSTIESWRRGDGPDGEDLAREFEIGRIAVVGDLAPDCMGNWMVFWRQCMPGPGNPCLDDEGRPMKNWWPFLFY